MYLGNDELLGFMRAREQLKSTTPVFSGYIVESNFDPAQFGNALDGVYYTFPALATERNATRHAFEQKFAEKFGASERPSVNAYFVFDGMHVLAEALTFCPPDKFACVWERLRNTGQNHQGVSGEFRFLDDGSISRSFVMKTVQGASFVLLKE